TGPEVIRVTTGEEVTFEELGGAEVHNVKSGVAHFLAQTEDECFAQTRRLLSFVPQSSAVGPPTRPEEDPADRRDPELGRLVPDSAKEPYDIKDVIVRVVDGGDFLEVQPFHAMNLVVGFARLGGHPVGVV